MLQAGKPKPLFRAPVLGSLTDYRNYYAVTADGTRFLIDSVAAGTQPRADHRAGQLDRPRSLTWDPAAPRERLERVEV